MNADNATQDLVRRILVAMDPSAETESLLDFAADLAAELGASLAGVFVEDTDIAEYAELPFAREISLSGAVVRNLSRQRVQSYYRAEAERARRALEAAGRRRRIQCSFELRRGRLESELAAAAQEWDLVAVSPGAGAVVRPRGHDITARMGTSAAVGFLAFKRHAAARTGIVAVFTASPEAERAVALAARIASQRNTPLTIIVDGDADDRLRRLAAAAGRVEIVEGKGQVAGLLRALTPRPQIIILPADLADDAQAAAQSLEVPTLVIRRSQGAK